MKTYKFPFENLQVNDAVLCLSSLSSFVIGERASHLGAVE